MAIRQAFWDRLAREIEGDAACDLFTRGRYSTDASMYQCFPAGAVCPGSAGDIAIAIEMAREEGLSVIARGGGTSTAGQALGEGVVLDFSKYLNRILAIDADARTAWVEPGCTPAALNAALKPHGLIFPVDIASARQATIGGMLGNNTSGLRALRYGSMRDNVLSVDAFLADCQNLLFNQVSESGDWTPAPGRDRLLDLLQFGELHEKAIATLWPLRAPGTPEPEAYDLRTLLASSADHNMARLIAASAASPICKARSALCRRSWC
jgi:FAD/FMN-containing dehydrogenase